MQFVHRLFPLNFFSGEYKRNCHFLFPPPLTHEIRPLLRVLLWQAPRQISLGGGGGVDLVNVPIVVLAFFKKNHFCIS